MNFYIVRVHSDKLRLDSRNCLSERDFMTVVDTNMSDRNTETISFTNRSVGLLICIHNFIRPQLVVKVARHHHDDDLVVYRNTGCVSCNSNNVCLHFTEMCSDGGTDNCLFHVKLQHRPISITAIIIYVYIYYYSVVCLTTGPKPPPKRFLHIVRSKASSFK